MIDFSFSERYLSISVQSTVRLLIERNDCVINIAICDDNIIFMNNFQYIIEKNMKKYTDDFKITTASNGSLLLAKHLENEFNIIFLDIDMPNVTGFDVARELREHSSRCFIIFITNHSELVYESMDFQPFNFIRKNCDISIEESVEKIVQKLVRHMKQNEKIILEDDISGRNAVYLKDVTYIESEKHYVYYNVLNKEYPIKMRDNISDLADRYSSYDFIRIHKRYLVNLRFLSDIDSAKNEIVLEEINKRLPMSKNYKKDVDEKYTLFLRSMI